MSAPAPAFSSLQVGATFSTEDRTPGPVDLFLFVSVIGIAHRIHYDQPYTVNEEGHRGLVVPGGLQGTYLMQLLERWAGAGVTVRSFAYRHLTSAYVGEPIRCFGSVESVDPSTREVTCKVRAETSAATILTTGEAVLRWP